MFMLGPVYLPIQHKFQVLLGLKFSTQGHFMSFTITGSIGFVQFCYFSERRKNILCRSKDTGKALLSIDRTGCQLSIRLGFLIKIFP
jgi:hypothetical protein